jgi:hypothetical protein
MRVKITGASAFVNRMFEAAGPFQYVREFAKNSIEAGATRVEFGIEWQAVESIGVYRRTVVDNGAGMSAKEMLDFFSTLGASGKIVAGVHDNYGVGAKIAALPWNPNGVVVVSRQNGLSSMIWIALNPNGDYELVEFERPEGYRVVVPPAEYDGVDWASVLPRWVGDHGTAVVLLGDNANPNTALGHPRAGGTDLRGISTYLNTRFWDIPIDVRVAELRSADPAKWPRGPGETDDARRINLRRIKGAAAFVGPLTGCPSGEVLLDEGRVKAKWWLWPGRRPAVHSYAKEAGYIGVVYDGEIYQMTSSKAHYRWFGIAERDVQAALTVVLEPQKLADGWGVYPDSSRARLMFAADGRRAEEIPLANWGYEFGEKMPEAIREAVRAARGDTTQSGEIDESYRKRLQDRFAGARFSMAASVAGEGDATGVAAGPAGRGRRGAGLLTKGSDAGAKKRAAQAPQTPEVTGDGAESAKPTRKPVDIPRYRFTGISDFEQPYHIAAWAPHEADGAVVLVNAEAPVVGEMVAHWVDLYPEIYAEPVAAEVRRAIGEIAACKVAHVQRLTAMLPEEVVDREYRSEAALTTALMGLIDAEALIASRLRGKFRMRAEG